MKVNNKFWAKGWKPHFPTLEQMTGGIIPVSINQRRERRAKVNPQSGNSEGLVSQITITTKQKEYANA